MATRRKPTSKSSGSTGEASAVTETSPDLAAERLEWLAELFPEAITEGKVDIGKLQAALGTSIETATDRYTFTWAGKQEALQLLQLPSRAALRAAEDESIDFSNAQHLFLEGDNLEVLKVLYRAYFGQVKMIYIDPPYNTGNDFVYRDNYIDPLETYLQLTGQKDSDGKLLTSNPETGGRFHSAWLSMMYPRLFLARQLLADDGVVFVSIDDHEVDHLRLLMNELFGEENFVALITAQTNPRGRTLDRFIAKTHEYIMIFARSADSNALSEIPKDERAMAAYRKKDGRGRYRELELRNRNPVFNRKNRPNLFFPLYVDPKTGSVSLERTGAYTVEVLPLNSRGVEGCWTWGAPKVAKNLDLLAGRQARTGAWRVFRKDYLPPEGATTKAKSIWLEPAINHENGKEELSRLFDGRPPYDFPKSVELLKKCIELGTDSDSGHIIMDFFAGSCTTAQAVLELNQSDGGNRRFIMVELPEPTPEGSTARDMGFETTSSVGKERIRRAIAKLKDNGESQLKAGDTAPTPGFRVFELNESSLKRWTGVPSTDGDDYVEQMAAFGDGVEPGASTHDLLWEVALREGLSPVSHLEPLKLGKNEVWRMTDPHKGQTLLLCVDESLAPDTVEALQLTRDDVFVCRDAALTDELAANLTLQCTLKSI